MVKSIFYFVHILKWNLNKITLGLYFFICITHADMAYSKSIQKDTSGPYNQIQNQKNKIELLIAKCEEFNKNQQFDSTFNTTVQNLIHLAEKYNNKQGMADGYRYLGNSYAIRKDSIRSLVLYDKSLMLYNEIQNKTGAIKTLMNKGLFYIKILNYHEGLENFQRALDIALSNKKTNVLPGIYVEMGHIYYKLLDFIKAYEYYNKALVISNQLHNDTETTYINYKIGELYYHLGEYDKALNIAEKNYKSGQTTNNLEVVASSLSWQGNILMVLGKFKESLEKYRESEILWKERNNEKKLASDYANVAYIYHLLNDYNSALVYHKKCYNLAKKVQDKYSQMLYYKDMGQLVLNAPDSILLSTAVPASMRYHSAIKFENEALQIAMELDDTPQKIYILKVLIKAYEKSGDYKNALKSSQSLFDFNQRLSGQGASAALARVEIKHSFQQKELLYKIDSAKTRFYLILTIFILFLVIIIAFFRFYVITNKRKQERLLLHIENEKIEADLNNARDRLQYAIKNIHEKNTTIESITKELNQLENMPHQVTLQMNVTLSELKTKRILTEDDWLEFLKAFNRIYPVFTTTIRTYEPTITNSELRYLMLTKIGMGHKEMANILGVSNDTVRVTWNRTRIKLNGCKEDTPHSLLEKIGVNN